VQDVTGSKPGKTDIDPKFHMQTASCLGCCALGPVVETDPKNHGMMTISKRAEVPENYDYDLEKYCTAKFA
jgi:NADH-quinone oxidoreductase subunit E